MKYSTVVKNVTTTTSEGCKVALLTDEGQVHEFDEVVFTAPLGWLKQHPEAFNPPLPSRLTKAIASIGYGCLEKVGMDGAPHDRSVRTTG
jgi:hypothetical protein